MHLSQGGGSNCSATNGFKAWVLQEYEQKVHVVKPKAGSPNEWEVVQRKQFSQREFVAHVEKETGYPMQPLS